MTPFSPVYFADENTLGLAKVLRRSGRKDFLSSGHRIHLKCLSVPSTSGAFTERDGAASDAPRRGLIPRSASQNRPQLPTSLHDDRVTRSGVVRIIG